MKLKLFFLFAAITVGLTAAAQSALEAESKNTWLKNFVANDRVSIKFDYFGEIVLHPGLVVGAEYAFNEKKHITYHWDNEVGFYWHRWNNKALFLKSSVGARLYAGAAFLNISSGIGYMQSWPAGDIYVRTNDGDVKRTETFGTPHLISSLVLLLGWDGRKKELPFSIHLGPDIYMQSGFNRTWLPHLAFRAGVNYKFSGGSR